MIKGKRTTLIETLYKGEIACFAYEIYKGSDSVPHIRTYAILNDDFFTKIKIEELGQFSKELIEELNLNGYASLTQDGTKLQLKKQS